MKNQEQTPSDFGGRMDDFEFEVISQPNDEKPKTQEKKKSEE